MRKPPPSDADLAGMEAALRAARSAADLGEVPVGAVIIQAGAVLASTHNESVRRKDPTAHAEILAIRQALRVTNNDRLTNATLYVTLEPCAMCAGAMVLAKVGRLVFGAFDDRAGMCGTLGDLVRHPRLNHQVEVVSGVLGEESSALLKEFFRAQ